jgi:hypothetical protein
VDWGLGSAWRKFLAGHHIEKNKKGEGKMKKLFLVLMLVSLVALFAVPAMAKQDRGCDSCNVSVDVDVYKRATFCEHTFIDKDLFLNVYACVKANQWAQATISDCQVSHNGNYTAKGDPEVTGWTGTMTFNKTKLPVDLTADLDVTGKVKGSVKGDVIDDVSRCKVDKDPFYGKFYGDIKDGNAKGDVTGSVDLTGLEGNIVVTGKAGVYIKLNDSISASFNQFTGIAQVNQAAGAGNNQGNALAAAVTDPNDPNGDSGDGGCYSNYLGRDGRRDNQNNDPKGAVAHTEVAIGQYNFDNTVELKAAKLTDEISDSFKNFTGVAQVNQAAGFGNNQKNAAAIAANVKTAGAVAVSDAFMSQTNCYNTVDYKTDTTIKATIDGSFKSGCGLAQVNQSPGSLNNQANTVAISYSGFNH